LMNGAWADPMIWSKEWFSSTTTMIRRGPAVADRLLDGAALAVVVGGLVGVVATGARPPPQPARTRTASPASSPQDPPRGRLILVLECLSTSS
jgi:hypothetical protein